MTPHTFRIGNNVEVIGPSITGNDIHLGETFKIKCMYVNPSQHIQFEPYDGTYYPASSLQLVEPELKIGDFAEVILPDNPFTGKIGQVSSIGELTVALYDIGIWSRGNLRKLTPEEIKRHTNPGKQYPITPAKDFDELTLRDVARMAGICKNEYGVWISTLLKRAHETEDRLSAIEKRQEEARKYSDDLYSITETLAERIYALQKRVEFVEKFQREQAEAAQYRRNMLWMAGP